MLNDEASSLRISSSPVHRRVSKPSLADVNPPLALLARYPVRLNVHASHSVSKSGTKHLLQEICLGLAGYSAADRVLGHH